MDIDPVACTITLDWVEPLDVELRQVAPGLWEQLPMGPADAQLLRGEWRRREFALIYEEAGEA